MEEINTKLLLDKTLFLEIHRLKNEFITLFSQISNQISDEELYSFASKQNGKKISKGNELEHCPYQVLDLVRNFNKESGFNIRLLNWWGHGLFILIYHGSKNLPSEKLYQGYLSLGYQLTLTGSPWDYKSIVVHHKKTDKYSYGDLPEHLKKVKHLQLIKAIPYTPSMELLKTSILNEWLLLKKFCLFQ